MSNRRRIRLAPDPEPPASILALAASYQCGSCDADIGKPYFDQIWHLSVFHDDSCPVRRGIVDGRPQGVTAARAAARAIGKPVLYVTPDDAA